MPRTCDHSALWDSCNLPTAVANVNGRLGLQGQQKSHKFECIVCQSVQPAVSGHKYLLKYKSILQHFYPQVRCGVFRLRVQRFQRCAAAEGGFTCSQPLIPAVRKRIVLYVARCTRDLRPVQELRPVN